MTYTEEAKQALSRKVAEHLNTISFKSDPVYQYVASHNSNGFWLHDDWHTLCEECNKRGIWVRPDGYGTGYFAYGSDEMDILLAYVAVADCDSPSEADRIARLMALGEIKLETTK